MICIYNLYFQLDSVLLPQCEKYYRDQGYDFKFSNGRVVLVRRTRHIARRWRRGQVGPFINFLLHFSFDQLGPSLTFSANGVLYVFTFCSKTASLWKRVTPCRLFLVKGKLISPSPGPAWDWSECWRGRGLGSLWTTSLHQWITSWLFVTSQR